MKNKHKTPRGTVALLTLYIILLIVLWGSTYLTMLSRGGVG